jgi:secondary thiamine-phosphate synthase enzyme
LTKNSENASLNAFRGQKMTTWTTTMSIQTKFEGDMVLLDHLANDAIKKSELSSGIITLFIPGSTGAITTIEYEDGLKKDFPSVLEKLVSKQMNYRHNTLNFDDNAVSHIKAAIIGPSLSIPFKAGRMMLGTWQQTVFIELDTRGRQRNIEVMIIS